MKLSSFQLGPGIILAATGLGAGDLIASAVAGAEYGHQLMWAVVVGAFFKGIMNEALARWQLASGHSLIDGIAHHLPKWVTYYLLLYIVLWGFMVSAALMAACGLAGHALFPELSVPIWGCIHALVIGVLVFFFNYQKFENIMKVLIALMFAMVLYCAFQLTSNPNTVVQEALQFSIPKQSLPFILGVIGGVGGSLTVLCYGYWLKEKNWNDSRFITASRWDLTTCYVLTGLFGLAVIVVSAGAQPEAVKGSKMVLSLANQLAVVLGEHGRILFLVGFWAAVGSSMLGVWQGVPSLFADTLQHVKPSESGKESRHSVYYTGFLIFLIFPPMMVLFTYKPVWLVIAYAILGALFMPFLALVLLFLNNRQGLMGEFKNRWFSNLGLVGSVLLFAALLFLELNNRFFS